jgi:hypothetical protein
LRQHRACELAGAAADRSEQRPLGIATQTGAVEIGGEVFFERQDRVAKLPALALFDEQTDLILTVPSGVAGLLGARNSVEALAPPLKLPEFDVNSTGTNASTTRRSALLTIFLQFIQSVVRGLPNLEEGLLFVIRQM